MGKEVLDKIKKMTEEVLKRLGVKADISLGDKNQIVYVKLTKTEAALLIGFQGETLKSLQHILRLLILRELGDKTPTVLVDVENYREQEEEKLKDYVRKVAEIVKSANRAEILRPMSSYKRRLVHLAVAEVPGVSTESVGDGTERKIIIKPGEKTE